MENNLDARAGLRANRRIGQVALQKLHRLQADQILALAGNEVVDAANSLAARQQRRGNRAADKAGGSGNEIFGQCFSPGSRTRSGPVTALVNRPT